jgi:peptidyl-prolyl cis-trans isomerase A (cyclophilin A)
MFLFSSVYVVFSSLNSNNQKKDNTGYPVAEISTSKGLIVVELYNDKAPKTCDNFIKLAKSGFYDGLVFHRVIDNFMIQTGGFLPDGTQKSSPYDNIKFETSDLKHVDGAISMASTGPKVGGSAQFFICDGAQSGLDGNYAVFGKVIEGMDVVREISSVQTTTKFTSYSDWPVNDIIINNIKVLNE